jgi:hypothetical protein
LLSATEAPEIRVACARCTDLLVNGVAFHRQYGVFPIPVTETLSTINALCLNVDAVNCWIQDERFTGFGSKLAKYASDAGVIGMNFTQTATPLFAGVRQQIITGNSLDFLLYEKTWEGSVEFVDLPNGPLVYEIDAIARNGQKGAYVRAYLAGLLVPFAPLQFLSGSNQSFATIGVTGPEQPGENDLIPNYLPDGDLIVNADYFNYTLGSRDAHDPLTKLVDVPAALIQSFEFRCSDQSQTIDGKCIAPNPPGSKGLSSGAIIGIAIASVVIVAGIVVVVIVILRRRSRATDGYRSAPTQ